MKDNSLKELNEIMDTTSKQLEPYTALSTDSYLVTHNKKARWARLHQGPNRATRRLMKKLNKSKNKGN